MSFFNKIAKKITNRFKKAQTLGYDTIEDVDRAIDQVPEEQFSGEMTPEFLHSFVINVKTYLSKINPSNPLASPIAPLPPIFHTPALADQFDRIATHVLMVEKGIDQDTTDIIINYLLGEGDLIATDTIDQQIAKYIRSIPEDFSSIPPIDKILLSDMVLFQSISRRILSEEYRLDSKQTDEVLRLIINPELQTKTEYEFDPEIEKEFEPSKTDIQPDIQPEVQPEVQPIDERSENLPESIKNNLREGLLRNPEILFEGLDDLDQKLGKGLYSIEEKSTSKKHDLYPVRWSSPSSQLFRKTFLENADGTTNQERVEEILNHFVTTKKDGGAGMIQDIRNILWDRYKISFNKNEEDDIKNRLWESLNPENIPLGRSMYFSPEKGSATCYKDYLVDFFINNPQYLKGTNINMSVDTHTSGRGNEIKTYLFNRVNLCSSASDQNEVWRVRNELSNIMADIMMDEQGQKSVADYVYKAIPSRIINDLTVLRRRERGDVSMNAPSSSGKEYGGVLSQDDLDARPPIDAKDKYQRRREGKVEGREILGPYSSLESGGEGNIFREIYQDLGEPTVNSLSAYIEEIKDGKIQFKNEKSKNQAILRRSLVADSLQAFMLTGSNQLDNFVPKEEGNFRITDTGAVGNEDGSIILDLKGNEVKKWRGIVSSHSLSRTISDIAKAKALISNMNLSQSGSSPDRIAQRTAIELGNQGITPETDPVVFAMLKNDDFIKRSRLDPALMDEMYKTYRIGQSPGKFNGAINYLHNYFLEYFVKSIVSAENNIKQTYADDPATMKHKLWRLDKMKSIFGQTYPSHSYFNNEEEGAAVGGKINKGLTELFGSPTTPRAAWWMATGRMDIPPIKSTKESQQFVNGLYKIGNSILAELVKSQNMLDGFGLGSDAIKTINKIGDEYRIKIESLKND